MRNIIMLLLFAFSAVANADEVRLTMYDDGLSCPNNCDAHVVFHSSMNGTEYAHDPSSSDSVFKPCTKDAECNICFENNLKQCMHVIYRGGGPSINTFDLTPEFYTANCPSTASYPTLQRKCSELKVAADRLTGRVNCISNERDAKCKARMEAAKAAKAADDMLYQSCLAEDEKKFNLTQPKEKQRSLRCAYEKYGTGGPNSHGTTWRKLLPAACRGGTFVGKDGLDCCSGNVLADGPLGSECRGFYPK